LSPTASTVRVGVVFGGPSPEHDVSILTGLQAAHELDRSGRETVAIYWSKLGAFHKVDPSCEAADFLEGVPRGAEDLKLVAGPEGGMIASSRLGRGRQVAVDVIVNCCHGGPGEDGTLQAALDLAGISYTGPSVSGAAIGMDKLAFSGLMVARGLPALPRLLLEPRTVEVGFDGPYILKPRFGGSSIGVDIVEDLPTALARLTANVHLRAGAVMEPYRAELFDLNVGARSWPEISLSAVERPLRSTESAEILDYSDKYVGSEGMASAPRELPADIPDGLDKAVRDAALETAGLCGLRGVARIDFLSDGESFFVNEINTIPGSLARYLWVDPLVAFSDLLESMIDEALQRPSARYATAGADGSVLRRAGNIASKLS